MCWFETSLEGRLGRIDWSGGPDDESDETNLMKKTVLAHSAWFGGSTMAWRGKIYRLDWSGGPDGDRAVQMD